MDKLSNEEFISFLESFKENKKYYDTITEIARPVYNKGSKGMSVFYSQFKIFSLDDMKHDCKLFKHNFPKSTDGIYYKITKDGELVVILIEFKGIDFSVDSSLITVRDCDCAPRFTPQRNIRSSAASTAFSTSAESGEASTVSYSDHSDVV